MPLVTGPRPEAPDRAELDRLRAKVERVRALLEEPGHVTREELLSALDDDREV